MKIKKIEIKNYRSCLNTTFELDSNLSIFIGPNGSGKTNVLCAILLLKKLLYEDDLFRYRRDEEKPTGRSKLKVEFEVENKKVILTAEIMTYTNEENNDIIVSSRQQWYLKDFTGSAKRIVFPLRLVKEMLLMHRRGIEKDYIVYRPHFRRSFYKELPSEKNLAVINKIAQYLDDMKYYSASQFTNPGNCPISFHIEKEGRRRRGLRLSGHSKFLFDLFNEYKNNKKSKYNQYIDIIGPNGIGLIDKLDFNEILTSSIDYSVRSGGKVREQKREMILVIPKFTIGKHELSPNQLSEGTFKTITLLFYLITESSNCLLIEEPEVCVHHGLLSSIIDLIKTYSDSKQILVSTHSDFVLDKVEPHNVFKVSRKQIIGTKVKNLKKAFTKREFKALKDYLDNEGNLGEYWKHGALE